jgi:multidrug efflux system membrane fusion protein
VEPTTKKRWTRIALGAIALIVVAGAAYAYFSRNAAANAMAARDAAAAANRIVPVVVVPVTGRDMPIYLEGLGNVLSSATVTVHVQVDGMLQRVAFRQGQSVRAGDLLAQIDPRPFQATLDSAVGALMRDQAQLAEAVVNLERYRALSKNGLTTLQAVDDQAALVKQLRGTTIVDQAAIDSARLSLEYTRVTAPIDGVTGIRLVDQGNLVHQIDVGGLVVLTTLDPSTVVFTLPQENLTEIAIELAAGPITVKAISRDGAADLATGTLLLIDNQINQTTATIRLRAEFPNPAHLLWPNAFVKARLLLATRKNAIVVPSVVVQQGPEGAFAYVVDADQRAVMRPIVIDIVEGELSVVSSGLQVGESVVFDGQSQLRPGAKVAPRARDAPPQDGKSALAPPASPGPTP